MTTINSRQNTRYAALEHPLINGLLRMSKLPEFGGVTAIATGVSRGEFWATSVLRWQSEQGKRLRREFIAITRNEAGDWSINNNEFSQWLLHSAAENLLEVSQTGTNSYMNDAYYIGERRLQEITSEHLFPESIQELSAAITVTT